MNAEIVSQLFFDERYVVPVETGAAPAFPAAPHGAAVAPDLGDAMATGRLVAVLESMCIEALHPHVDRAGEVVVGAGVECRHRGPVPAGACMRLTGWVERIGERSVTFRVQGQDEHEQVCEGTIRLAVVDRATVVATLVRKSDALERRRLFAAAA